jgi:hypothetical protein
MTTRVLYAEDLALLHGISVRQARRRLLDLEAQYGERVVGRTPWANGVRRFTTEQALASFTPCSETLSDKVMAAVERLAVDVRALGERISFIEARHTVADGHSRP